MAEVNAGSNVTVRVPDDVEVRVVGGGPARRGVRRGAPSAMAASAELKAALSAANLDIVAEVEIAPTRPGTRAIRRDRGAATEIEVKVGPSESALVLLEGAGGVYAWSYPRPDGRPPSTRRGATQRTLVFPLAPTAGGRAGARGVPSGRRGAMLDWLADKFIEPVRAYVLKFAVTAVIDITVDYLEGDKPVGLVALAGDDPAQWRPGGAPLPTLPQDRPLKILLMVHGTFSSTAGGFGHFMASEGGRSFLQQARQAYDAILGFDHKTLVEDPEANAMQIADALDRFGIPKGSSVDAIAHSRGGLVYRMLAEKVLANRRPDIKLGKAIFVGCTNGGTHLAEPENWAAMVDLYTNAIMAGARAIVSLTGGALLSPVVSVGIKTVGRFVQMFSEVAVGESRVPGLAAMQPTGATVKGLNEAAGGLDRLAAYYAMSSNFVARLEPRNGITKELAEFVADRVTNRLFQGENDLVVDTASMTTFGTRKARLDAGGTFTFGDTDDVYHTIYFAADRAPGQLAEWLGLGLRSAPSVRENGPPQLESFRPDRLARGTRGTRGGVRGVTATVGEPTLESTVRAPAVPCYFAAEMEPTPALKKRVPLFVTVSREKIEVAEHAAARTSDESVAVAAGRKIIVEVTARKNCKLVGDSSAEIDIPAARRPETLRFMVEGDQPGAADILVEIRQGARMLVSHALAPVFVDSSGKKLGFSHEVPVSPEGPDEPAVLRIYEIVDGSRITLRFDLTCDDPNISLLESRTLPAGFSREAYVSDIFKEIEDAWLATGRVYDRFLLKLKANGIQMANHLLPEKIRKALWQHRDAIHAIQVISEEPFIPWELIYVVDPDVGPDGKGFLSEWGLVRWLHSTRWPGRRLALNKERVRYVIPDYVDPGMQLAGAAEERAMLKSVFGNPQAVKAESISVAEFLQKEAKNCDVLHFACHGEAVQRAVMRADLLMTGDKIDGNFVVDALDADVVKTHARFAPDGPRPIVFINACQTGRGGAGLTAGVAGFVDAFLRPMSEQGAGALVGALWSVDDKLAFNFAQAFYKSLLDNKTLVDAARAAREAAKDKKDFTWLAYTVYGSPFARMG